jgi:hypothetical protein
MGTHAARYFRNPHWLLNAGICPRAPMYSAEVKAMRRLLGTARRLRVVDSLTAGVLASFARWRASVV